MITVGGVDGNGGADNVCGCYVFVATFVMMVCGDGGDWWWQQRR